MNLFQSSRAHGIRAVFGTVESNKGNIGHERRFPIY